MKNELRSTGLTLACFLVGSFAFASDIHIGDKATYDVLFDNGAKVAVHLSAHRQIESYNRKTKEYRTHIHSAGHAPEFNEKTEKELEPEGSAKNIFKHCASLGGTYENVTVAAGTFRTCAVITADGKSLRWVSPQVPFGDVKAVYVDRQTNWRSTYFLREFQKGH